MPSVASSLIQPAPPSPPPGRLQVLATVTAVTAAAAAGAPPPQAGLPWVDRLAEISVPVTVVSARRASRMARAIADMAPDGRFVAAAADTDLVWLEDRI